MDIITNPKETEKSNAIKAIIGGSAPNKEFYILIGLSVVLATLGILLQNVTVIIGSMLVAPLLYPLLAVSLGLATLDRNLIARSIFIISRSLVISLITAVTVSLVFFNVDRGDVTAYLQQNLSPSFLHLAVGVFAGLAAAFAITKENLSAAIPGVAIAVALIPPLAAVGVSVALFDIELVLNSVILFTSNMLGIIVATTLLFMTMNFKSQERNINKSLEAEERDLELENN